MVYWEDYFSINFLNENRTLILKIKNNIKNSIYVEKIYQW